MTGGMTGHEARRHRRLASRRLLSRFARAFLLSQSASVFVKFGLVEANDPLCWNDGLTYEDCCTRNPEEENEGVLPADRAPFAGNPNCWNHIWMYTRCCNTFAAVEHDPWHSDEESEWACATDMFQRFKYETNLYYETNATYWTLLQAQSYMIGRFDHVFRVCAPAALQAFLLKLESIYYLQDGNFEDTFTLYVDKFTQAVTDGRVSEAHFRNGWPLRVGLERVLHFWHGTFVERGRETNRSHWCNTDDNTGAIYRHEQKTTLCKGYEASKAGIELGSSGSCRLLLPGGSGLALRAVEAELRDRRPFDGRETILQPAHCA